VTKAKQKQTGSFYTVNRVAEFIAKWAIRSSNDSVLEPSFGDGIFIDQAINRFKEFGNNHPSIAAVELQPDIVLTARTRYDEKHFEFYLCDFLSTEFDCHFDVVIGNPPYVSLRTLPDDQYLSAKKVINEYGTKCPNNGSLWFPFVLHAISSIKDNGRLAFVMPFEITYARYASELWSVLSNNFAKLSIFRIYEDFFPNVDVETVLLFAEDKGGFTNQIEYSIFETVDDLLSNKVSKDDVIHISEIIRNNKPFVYSSLPPKYQQLHNTIKKSGLISPLIESCKFKIGYVSADKSYFHPNSDIISHYNISKTNLVPTILNAKQLNGGSEIGIEVLVDDYTTSLYLPNIVTDDDFLYIKYGESLGVHQRYKCKRRNPWYITPSVETPDVILSVFGDIPKLVMNKGGYAVTNSLLAGFIKNDSAQQLLCRWYNSLTLLSLELNVHSLGGGSFVVIPGEADKLEIIDYIPEKDVEEIYCELNAIVKTKGVKAAYNAGDELVLRNIFNLSQNDIYAIRDAVQYLRNWRTPANRRNYKITHDNKIIQNPHEIDCININLA